MSIGWFQPSASHPRQGRDVALAVLCCFFDLLVFSRIEVEPTYLAIVAYAVTGYAFLVWRNRIPLTVFTAAWVHSVIAAVAIPDYRPVFGVVVALYTVVAVQRLRIGLAALAVTFIPVGFGAAREFDTASPDRAAAAFIVAATLLSLFNVGAWLLGRKVHADRRKVLILERQREMAAREAVVAERDRLARELHDIIAHCVSVILLQAAGARRILASDPDRAAAALANIEHSGVQATEELRRLLGVLRAGEPVPPGDGSGGQHGLDELQPLLDRVRAAGVTVHLRVHGAPRSLDPSVDLSAYRVVQEALTNVTKHAGPAAESTVELRWDDDVLHLAVTDDGGGRRDRASAPVSTGHGLLGLRERAVAVGGQLQAGPLPGGGFQVRTTVPAPGRCDGVQSGRTESARRTSATSRDSTDVSVGEGPGE